MSLLVNLNNWLHNFNDRAAIGFLNLDAVGEFFFQLVDVGDDQDLGKILPDQADGFD